MSSGIEILVSDHHGIYIPKVFTEECEHWNGIDKEDFDILRIGPDEETYWEAWDNILTKASYTDKNGYQWQLYQDGDLFAICTELMSDEDYAFFFGEKRMTHEETE